MDRIIAPGKFLIQDLTPKKLAFLKKGDLSLNLTIFLATESRSLGGVKRGRVVFGNIGWNTSNLGKEGTNYKAVLTTDSSLAFTFRQE
ncbi:MAG TPA: hypothetical protein PK747_10225 [Acidobacteriota bacterium]|nr:hypothetical protein [Acidobacteriota bacterium]HQQ47766.1 hypothetical protein [Acidobacteriota bacterium]